jgi:hypothetical protein
LEAERLRQMLRQAIACGRTHEPAVWVDGRGIERVRDRELSW